jgi:hypothetical protein
MAASPTAPQEHLGAQPCLAENTPQCSYRDFLMKRNNRGPDPFMGLFGELDVSTFLTNFRESRFF